ncbi:DUF2380 domain-containing protein [Pyxidicoccus fallax]|uniref:DUF2380 domain-containing protein n=1 Tax=Pyxidicoccus fallax TaxID=394095 RepID=A0A848LRN2_9BACT|nr:DUF2380 domain-containing protein [Pyxidicoccus fallax]NMO20587.1 DUF2380 domain-containing protein [Pyxidicoccus fallax]NPC83218.1 DUF2380 domain-containing protein [Pyxidicoccus fallax]
MKVVALLLLSAALLAAGCSSRAAGSREDATGAGPDRVKGTAGGPRQIAARTRRAVVQVADEVRGATGEHARSLSALAARPPGLGNRGLSGGNGAFTRFIDHGSRQSRWIDGALGGVSTLTGVASETTEADMQWALLRMTGPRLQAAMLGALLLATWVDFLQLADAVLRQCPAYSVERLFVELRRVQGRMEPTLTALASLDAERVEAAATAMPELMGQLTREFGSIQEGARVAMERREQLLTAMQFMEMLTLVSALKMSLPRLPPAAPASLGVGLVMGSGGVMVGSRVVVSAEWVEAMRRLVQAGVISVPVVSAAVRIHGGQVLMAQASGDLPPGVRDALGDGPEVRAMHETGRAGAGMSEAPRHHVLPREHREWFEQRGFTGAMDIDQFCVRLEAAQHQAIHGGGNWRLGRTWPGEWNRMIMEALREAEAEAGRKLTRNNILNIVAERMKFYDVPMSFTPGRRR